MGTIAVQKKASPNALDVRWASGPVRITYTKLTFAATYDAAGGGEPCDFTTKDASLFPTGKILAVLFFNVPLGYEAVWVSSAPTKVKIYTSGGSELANTSGALNGLVADALVIVQAN